jgi:hypothetical protein
MNKIEPRPPRWPRAALLLLLATSCATPDETSPPASIQCGPYAWVDQDGDGFTPCAALSVHRDCDDRDRFTHPGHPELCNGLDDDCDGVIPARERDIDQDGEALCHDDCDDARADLQHADEDGDGFGTCDGDCDDEDPAISPAAVEQCDGLDGDCDGVTPAAELDLDGDGDLACATDCDDLDPVLSGLDRDGDGLPSCGGDCDDLDPCRPLDAPLSFHNRELLCHFAVESCP